MSRKPSRQASRILTPHNVRIITSAPARLTPTSLPVYRTEAFVGQAIKESGLARSDIFITSKFSGIGTVEQAIQDSLRNVSDAIVVLLP